MLSTIYLDTWKNKLFVCTPNKSDERDEVNTFYLTQEYGKIDIELNTSYGNVPSSITIWHTAPHKPEDKMKVCNEYVTKESYQRFSSYLKHFTRLYPNISVVVKG